MQRFLGDARRPRPLTVDRAGGPIPQYIGPFVTTFHLDALAGADTEAAVELMRRTWSRQLEGDTTGTFWEKHLDLGWAAARLLHEL